MQAGADVVLEHRPRPAVERVALGVLVPQCGVAELVKQGADVAPRQFPNGRWKIASGWGRAGAKGPHVLQVGRRQAPHVGELPAQLRGEALDDPGIPTARSAAGPG